MPTLRRLTNSCLLVSTDDGTTLFDPGFFTFDTDHIDLDNDRRRAAVADHP